MFTAIITSHNNRTGLEKMINNLKNQTRKPDEIIVLGSDVDLFGLDVDKVVYCQNMNDWGHDKRDGGIQLASKDWIGFFNDDDSYDSTYIEEMMKYPDADVVFCGWNKIHKPQFRFASSTSGNFIVRTWLARKVGWKDRDYAADGKFIDAIARETSKIVFVDKILYYHNQQ